MKRVALAGLVLLAGCQSPIDLRDEGRAYACTRDGGAATGCTFGWACGDDLRCFDPAVGAARVCERAETGCGGGWKCGFDKVCFNPDDFAANVRSCSDSQLHCPRDWRCGFDNTCFDPERFDGPLRACADPVLHCPRGWRCGIDRLCFDPASMAVSDGGTRQCTNPQTHCATGQRCGLDGLCFTPTRSPDAGAGPDCVRDEQCAVDWRCGIEDVDRRRRCQPVGVGGAWACSDDTHCEGWRCNPVTVHCTAPPPPPAPVAFSAFEFEQLSPRSDAGLPLSFSVSAASGNNRLGRTIATLDATGARVVTRTPDEFRIDGGIRRVFVSRLASSPGAVVDVLAGDNAAWLLLADAGVTRATTGLSPTVTPLVVPALTGSADRFFRRLTDGKNVVIWRDVSDGGTVSRLNLDDLSARVWPETNCRRDFPGQQTGRLVDFAFITPTDVLFLYERGACITAPLDPDPFTFMVFDAGVASRVLIDPRGGQLPEHVLFELTLDGGALRHVSSTLRDQGGGTTPQNTTPPCAVCAGDVSPLFVMPYEGSVSSTSASLVARCPAATLGDAGVAATTWLISPRSPAPGNLCPWSYGRVLEDELLTPFRFDVVSRASQTNRPALAASQGRTWFWQVPSEPLDTTPGTLTPFLLDRAAEVGARISVAGREQTFFTSRNVLYAYDEQVGFYAQSPFPVAISPLASVSGQRAWVISATQVYDGRPQAVQTDFPPAVAIPPAGRTFGSPASATLQGTLLVVAAFDTLYVADVRLNLVSALNPPTEMSVAAVPAPGLPLRAVTAQPKTATEPWRVWTVTDTGVFLSTSDDLRRWTSVRVPLGPKEGQAISTWSTANDAFVVTRDGEVLSLPTAVPVSRPLAAGERIANADRLCGATVAIITRATDTALSVLQGVADGGLATWGPAQSLGSTSNVETAEPRLFATEDDLFISSASGRVLGAKPVLGDAGCPR